MVVARGWGKEGMGSYCLMGIELRMMKKFWRWTVVMVAQQCKCI